MNGWIESIAKLMNVGHGGFEFSFSDLRILLPDVRVCAVVMLFTAFWVLCAYQGARQGHGQDHKSDMDRK